MPRENHNSKRYMHPNVHCSIIYNSQDTETTYMFIHSVINKEDVLNIYNGILLSHKKEWNWIICIDMYGPRDCHIEWRKRKTNVIFHTDMWNLEKWYWWSYLQRRNRHSDIENKHLVTRRDKGVVRGTGSWDWHIHTIGTMYKIDY